MDATRFKKSPDPVLSEYWDNKHPTAPVVYNGRTIPGMNVAYPMDVRRFIWGDDVVLGDMIDSGDRYLDKALAADSMDTVAFMVQKAVVRSIQYVADKSLDPERNEFWLFPGETRLRCKGDCEDGAILIASLCLNLGIPPDRIRVAAGTVKTGRTETGGHAWATYRRESDDEWVALDWCFHVDDLTRVKDKKPLKDMDPYFGGNLVWFSFNNLHAWSHEEDIAIEGRIRSAVRGNL